MRRQRWTALLALVVAGEAIFVLPFVLPRVFRPTLLDVYGLSNLQLGTAYSAYGLVAMLAYGLGGPLADRFPARSLMVIALLATGLGGGVLLYGVTPLGLIVLYAWWGLTTILLFWAALIRATREWGGPAMQGRAYGLLDGGRGLLAALLATVSVAAFAQLLPESNAADLTQRTKALQRVIAIGTGLTVLAAGLAWWALPVSAPTRAPGDTGGASPWSGLRRVAGMPSLWLQATIIICAYAAYKATGHFSLYARDVLGYDDIAAAQVGTWSIWLRVVAAIAAGWLADRSHAAGVSGAAFVLVAVGCLGLAWGAAHFAQPLMYLLVVATASVGIYALRGVYYALTAQAQVPLAYTGAAVGLVSVLGFTPDVFAGPLYGYLLDRAPGLPGHRLVFELVAMLALVGAIAAAVFSRLTAARR